MNLKTIVDKISDGVKLILVQPTLLFLDRIQDITPVKEHVVKPFEESRPDLIALKYYGDQSKTDQILKFNGISDPFSIQEGEVIMIPPKDISVKRMERLKKKEDNGVRQQFVDTKRLSQRDQNRLESLKKKYGADEMLPPNVLKTGKRSFRITPGKITFGQQVQIDPVVKEVEQASKSPDRSRR